MSPSANNQASSLQPAPASASRAGALSQVLVPSQLPLMPMQQAGQLSLLPNDPQALHATLQQALNAAALANQAHPGMSHALQGPHFEAAAGSGITFPITGQKAKQAQV